MLNDIQKSILKTVSDMTGIPDGAVNIRLDGQKAFRQNSEHIQIVSKTDKDGIDIKIAPFTKSENVHIPVVLSKAGFHDMVYNDFFVGEDSAHALNRLLANFDAKMSDELMDKISNSPYSMYQILTIASLIEKETDGTDREKIASVIYNRLNNVGETYHKLQIDASLIYGLGERYTGTLTTADLEYNTPYNLSLYEGLPPTPIANPGLASIQAAVEPASTNYYFYALGTDGVHHFFKTYREHVNFVNSAQYAG